MEKRRSLLTLLNRAQGKPKAYRYVLRQSRTRILRSLNDMPLQLLTNYSKIPLDSLRYFANIPHHSGPL
jgi:hypothetical protein